MPFRVCSLKVVMCFRLIKKWCFSILVKKYMHTVSMKLKFWKKVKKEKSKPVSWKILLILFQFGNWIRFEISTIKLIFEQKVLLDQLWKSLSILCNFFLWQPEGHFVPEDLTCNNFTAAAVISTEPSWFSKTWYLKLIYRLIISGKICRLRCL